MYLYLIQLLLFSSSLLKHSSQTVTAVYAEPPYLCTSTLITAHFMHEVYQDTHKFYLGKGPGCSYTSKTPEEVSQTLAIQCTFMRKYLRTCLLTFCLCYTSVLADGTTPPPPDIQCSLNPGPTQATISCISSVEITGTECSIDGGNRQPCKDVVCSTCVCSPCKKTMSADSQIHFYGPVPHKSATYHESMYFPPRLWLDHIFWLNHHQFLVSLWSKLQKKKKQKKRKNILLVCGHLPRLNCSGNETIPMIDEKDGTEAQNRHKSSEKHRLPAGIKAVRSTL